MRTYGGRRCLVALLLWACAAPGSARAVLDNRDRGPALTAGNFSLRVTNAGIVGNAFFNIGLSNDPSFEFPKGSGNEALNYAALWVGALGPGDEPLVSGGPLLEFRPTLDPDDHVYLAESGRLGAERFYDDDGDGRVDEEILNECLEPRQMVEWMLEDELPVRLGLQLHKFVWHPATKGV